MTTPAHLGGGVPQGDSNTLCEDVFGFLSVSHDIGSLLDVGAGYGHTLKWFKEKTGCRVQGIDGDPDCIAKCVVDPGLMLLHDFTLGPAPIGTPSDFFWSAEFVEHVEEKFIPNYMEAFRLCRRGVITHAEPGQYGHHHVTLKTTEWWISKFAEFGFKHDPQETAMLRRTDRYRAGWGRRTLTSFIRV